MILLTGATVPFIPKGPPGGAQPGLAPRGGYYVRYSKATLPTPGLVCVKSVCSYSIDATQNFRVKKNCVDADIAS